MNSNCMHEYDYDLDGYDSEPNYLDPCVTCGKDQSQVEFASVFHCDQCGGTVCIDCVVVKPVKFDIVDETLCKQCAQ
jgi:hypothetical protein